MEDIPALLPGRGKGGSDDGEVVGTGLCTEATGDFLPQLHHAGIAFGLIIGEGHVRIVQKPQHVAPALIETEEKIVADPSRLYAASLAA